MAAPVQKPTRQSNRKPQLSIISDALAEYRVLDAPRSYVMPRALNLSAFSNTYMTCSGYVNRVQPHEYPRRVVKYSTPKRLIGTRTIGLA